MNFKQKLQNHKIIYRKNLPQNMFVYNHSNSPEREDNNEYIQDNPENEEDENYYYNNNEQNEEEE